MPGSEVFSTSVALVDFEGEVLRDQHTGAVLSLQIQMDTEQPDHFTLLFNGVAARVPYAEFLEDLANLRTSVTRALTLEYLKNGEDPEVDEP